MEINSYPVNSKHSSKHSQWNISQSLRIIQELMVMAERFADTFNRAFRKAWDTPTNKTIQQFLHVYRVTFNENAPSAMTSAEVLLARKIKSVFDKLLPNPSKIGHTNKVTNENWRKSFSRMFQSNKSYQETGKVDKQIGNMIYIIKGPNFTHKRHLNQISAIRLPPRKTIERKTMDVLFDTFKIPILQTVPWEKILTPYGARLKRGSVMVIYPMTSLHGPSPIL